MLRVAKDNKILPQEDTDIDATCKKPLRPPDNSTCTAFRKPFGFGNIWRNVQTKPKYVEAFEVVLMT
jgi:hypothetical protein